LGNDLYWVQDDQDTADLFIENANEGTDSVALYYATSYTLGANIENLIMSASGDATGTGNGLNNLLYAQGASNYAFYGLGGDDTLTGGAGNDLLDGGTGNDSLDGGGG